MTIHPPLPAVRPAPPSPLGADAAGSAPPFDVASPSLSGGGATLSEDRKREINDLIQKARKATLSLAAEATADPLVADYLRESEPTFRNVRKMIWFWDCLANDVGITFDRLPLLSVKESSYDG